MLKRLLLLSILFTGQAFAAEQTMTGDVLIGNNIGTVAPSGTDPYVYDFAGDSLDMNGFKIYSGNAILNVVLTNLAGVVDSSVAQTAQITTYRTDDDHTGYIEVYSNGDVQIGGGLQTIHSLGRSRLTGHITVKAPSITIGGNVETYNLSGQVPLPGTGPVTLSATNGNLVVGGYIKTSQDGGGVASPCGDVTLSGLNVTVNGATSTYAINAQTLGANNKGGKVTVSATNNITLTSGGISTYSPGTGGGAGDVTLTAGGHVHINGDVQAGSGGVADGFNVGAITLNVGSLYVAGNIDNDYHGSGVRDAHRPINIVATGTVLIEGFLTSSHLNDQGIVTGDQYITITGGEVVVEGTNTLGYSVSAMTMCVNEQGGDISIQSTAGSLTLAGGVDAWSSRTSGGLHPNYGDVTLEATGNITAGSLNHDRFKSVALVAGTEKWIYVFGELTGFTIDEGAKTFTFQAASTVSNVVYYFPDKNSGLTGDYAIYAGVVDTGKILSDKWLSIDNLAVSNVTTTTATFNGWLRTVDETDATVSVYWGETDAGTNLTAWANTNSWPAGTWGANSYPSTNITTLVAGSEYYYTFAVADNAASAKTNVVATPSSYLITGVVTAEVTVATCRLVDGDTGTFTISRPQACTNEALTVYYALSGTATNGVHYTISPAAGSVVIADGETNATITVSPVWKTDRTERTVILTLTEGVYVLDADPSATMTLAEVIAAHPYTWYPRNPNLNWNVATNWYGNAIPGASHLAIFDGLSSASNCNINVNIDVQGILITNYTGTITQESTRTVTIGSILGSSHYTQHSGTFVGGNTNITTSGNFTLTGGSFTAGAGQTITLSGPYSSFDVSDGTFNPSTSMVQFTGGGSAPHNSDLNTGSNSLYNCRFAKGSYGNVTATGTVNISNKLTIVSGHMMTGNFNVAGDVDTSNSILINQTTATITLNGTGAQTISNIGGGARLPGIIINKSSGVTHLVGVLTIIGANSPFTQTAGSLDAGTSTLVFAGGGNANHLSNLTVTDPLYNLTQNKGNNWGRLNVVGSVTVNNNLVISNGHGLLGTIFVKGNVSHSAVNSGSTAAITLNGAGAQTISNTAGTFPSGTLTINKSGGTLTLASDIALSGASQDLLWQSGAMDVVTNTLSVGRNLVVTNALTTLKWAYDSVDNGLISATAIDLDGPQNLVATWAGVGNPKEGTFNVMTWTAAVGPGTPDITVSGLPSGYRGLVQYSEGGKYIRLAVSQDISGEGEAFLVPNTLLVPNRLLVNEVSP